MHKNNPWTHSTQQNKKDLLTTAAYFKVSICLSTFTKTSVSGIKQESEYHRWVTRIRFRARLHETRSEIKPVWNLKPLWNVVPFTWQLTWRFHCSNFRNNSKTPLHMCKWYILINANLINAKQMLRYWLLFKQ